MTDTDIERHKRQGGGVKQLAQFYRNRSILAIETSEPMISFV